MRRPMTCARIVRRRWRHRRGDPGQQGQRGSSMVAGRMGSGQSGRQSLARSVLALATVLLLCVLAAVTFRAAMASVTGGRWILPLDDAYIHQQYARQAARGHFMRYNDQDPPSSGATSFAYPLILALFWQPEADGDALSTVAFLLGTLTLVASALLAGRIARGLAGEQSPWWVWPLGSALYLSNGALLFGHFSGMETGLVLAALLAYVVALLGQRPVLVALSGVCLAMIRPEALALVALGGAWHLLHTRDWRRPVTWTAAVAPVVFGFIQPMLNLVLTGSATANGMRVKGWLAGSSITWEAVTSVLGTLVRLVFTTVAGIRLDEAGDALTMGSGRPALYLPLALGAATVVWLLSRARCEWTTVRLGVHRPGSAALILGLMMATLSLNALMMTAEWHLYRYVLPVFALLLPAAAAAVAELSRRSALVNIAALLWLALGVMSVPEFVYRYADSSATVLHQQVAIGEWVQENLPESARIAIHDAGAIRFYGQRSTYDMLGLTGTAEASVAWREGAGAMYELMAHSPARPTHYATYPDIAHFPYLATAGAFGPELFRVDYMRPGSVAAAGETQSVYYADWSASDDSSRPQHPDVQAVLGDFREADSVNVADIQDEASHDYACWSARGRTCDLSEVHRLATCLPPHVAIADGGRIVSGGERFTLATRPGAALLLVGRFRGTAVTRLAVRVDGVDAGEISYWQYEGAWQERALLVPGELVSHELTMVEIQVLPQPGVVSEHRPYFWWAYQGDLPSVGYDHAVNVANAEGIRLLGYDLTQETTGRGETRLVLDLTWQADRATNRDLVTYVHWVGSDGEMLSQRDARPGDGTRPTWSWQPGFVVHDQLELSTGADASDSILYIGLYDPVSMDAVPLEGADSAGRLMLATLP